MKAARHGHSRSHQVRAIQCTRDKVITNVQLPPAECISSRAEIRRRNAIGNHNCFFQTNEVEVIAQHKEWNMYTIGDEAEPKFSPQAKDPLDNVVVARHRSRAAVTNMSKHDKTVIYCSSQLVERCVRMPSRNYDSPVRKQSSDLQPAI